MATGTMSQISYRVIPVRDLETFAIQAASEPEDARVLPITPWRAAAQARNPYARPDDPALIVAFDGSRIVGYLGALPGMFMTEDGPESMHFMIAWLVDETARGKGVGWGLVTRLMQEVDLLILTGWTESAGEVYKRRAKFGIPPCESTLVRFRNVEKTRQRFERAARILRAPGLSRLPERVIRSRQRRRARRFAAPALAAARASREEFEFSRVTRLGAESCAIRDREFRPFTFLRDSRIVNWMLAHPWVIPTHLAPRDLLDRYFFTGARDEFTYAAYEVSQSDETIGFAVFLVARRYGGRVMRLLDYSFVDSEAAAALVPVVARALSDEAPDALHVPACVAGALGVMQGNDHVTLKSRDYAHLSISDDTVLDRIGPENIRTNLCDGDFAFT